MKGPLLWLWLLVLCGLTASAQIASVTTGTAYRYNQGYSSKWVLGDTPNPSQCDDGNVYSFIDDTPSGMQGGLTDGANIMLAQFSGYTSSMTITMVNAMSQFGAFNTMAGSDSRGYKVSGMVCVNGVLYAMTNRQPSSPSGGGACSNGGFSKQTAQLIKSSNHGATWTPLPPSIDYPYTSPMFPGTGFVAGWPILYGQNYSCPNIDNCQNYVYWLSNKQGLQSQADSLYLARVSVANIGNLSASDWTYYQGGDGMVDGNWGALSTAAAVYTNSCKIGESGAVWIPAANRYLMVQFYYPDIQSSTSNSYWYFVQAPHPWGPWTQIGGEVHWNPQGYYMAQVDPVSVSGLTATVMTAGNYMSQDPQTGLYSPTILPITMSLVTSPTVADSLATTDSPAATNNHSSRLAVHVNLN